MIFATMEPRSEPDDAVPFGHRSKWSSPVFGQRSKDGRGVAILYEALVFADGSITARWHRLKK
jgi:hypothetical protein